MKTLPNWATSLVRNWRQIANLPDNIDDYKIYQIVTDNDLYISNATPDDEAQETIAYLRQELGLEE